MSLSTQRIHDDSILLELQRFADNLKGNFFTTAINVISWALTSIEAFVIFVITNVWKSSFTTSTTFGTYFQNLLDVLLKQIHSKNPLVMFLQDKIPKLGYWSGYLLACAIIISFLRSFVNSIIARKIVDLTCREFIELDWVPIYNATISTTHHVLSCSD